MSPAREHNLAWVRQRVAAMTNRPLMYAYTKESFVVQLSLMMDLLEIPEGRTFMFVILGDSRTNVLENLSDACEESWAASVGKQAMEVIMRHT